VAGCTGLLAWLLVERLRDGHATSFGGASGAVAGLVAITPSCGSVTPLGAMAIGAAAGAVCALAVGLKYRFGYDDSLDVVGVHFVGGVVGMLGIGLLASAAAPAAVDGLLHGGGAGQLGKQVVATLATMTYSFVVTSLLARLLDRTLGFRVDEEHESVGVDLVLHAETAYDLHLTAGGARPHLGG
jgi:Amt family ammonium transporter